MKKYSSYIFLLNPGRSNFKKELIYKGRCGILYCYLYHAIENAVNQNEEKLLYILQYIPPQAHRSVQFNCITPNLPIWPLHYIFYGMVKNSYATLSRGITVDDIPLVTCIFLVHTPASVKARVYTRKYK